MAVAELDDELAARSGTGDGDASRPRKDRPPARSASDDAFLAFLSRTSAKHAAERRTQGEDPEAGGEPAAPGVAARGRGGGRQAGAGEPRPAGEERIPAADAPGGDRTPEADAPGGRTPEPDAPGRGAGAREGAGGSSTRDPFEDTAPPANRRRGDARSRFRRRRRDEGDSPGPEVEAAGTAPAGARRGRSRGREREEGGRPVISARQAGEWAPPRPASTRPGFTGG